MNPDVAWKSRKVLVTGAAGFLGAHLCRRLVAAGADVLGVYRNTPPPDVASIAWRQADLMDAEAVHALATDVQPEVLFHLAGFAKGGPDVRNVLPSLHGDLLTAVHVLLAATHVGCGRIVVTGSLDEPLGDGPRLTPSSPYAAAKWAGTAYARMFHELFAAPVVIARPFMTYGPGQAREKIVPYVVRSLLKGQTPNLSDGQRLVDWVYVDDVIEGLLALGTTPGVEGHTIDLGSGVLVPICDVVERIVTLMDSPIRPAYGVRPTPVREEVRAADAEQTARFLDWRATTPLDVGLAETIDWYRAREASSARECNRVHTAQVRQP